MSNIGQQFLEKLIQDIDSGLWDGAWSVNSAGNIYSFVAKKEILTNSTFTLDFDNKGKELSSGIFIFSNGYGVIFENLLGLKDVVLISLERTVVTKMKLYDGPIIVEEDTSDDGENKTKKIQPNIINNKKNGENKIE